MEGPEKHDTYRDGINTASKRPKMPRAMRKSKTAAIAAIKSMEPEEQEKRKRRKQRVTTEFVEPAVISPSVPMPPAPAPSVADYLAEMKAFYKTNVRTRAVRTRAAKTKAVAAIKEMKHVELIKPLPRRSPPSMTDDDLFAAYERNAFMCGGIPSYCDFDDPWDEY